MPGMGQQAQREQRRKLMTEAPEEQWLKWSGGGNVRVIASTDFPPVEDEEPWEYTFDNDHYAGITLVRKEHMERVSSIQGIHVASPEEVAEHDEHIVAQVQAIKDEDYRNARARGQLDESGDAIIDDAGSPDEAPEESTDSQAPDESSDDASGDA